jgi:hypothetical protein
MRWLSIAFVVGISSLGAEPTYLREGIEVKDVISNGDGPKIVPAIVAARQASRNSVDQAILTQGYVWRTTIKFWGECKDEVTRLAILSEWDRGLGMDGYDDDVLIAAQVRALGHEWRREFATPKFYALFQSSENEKILSAISYVLAWHGDAHDKEILEKRSTTASSKLAKDKIERAIAWFGKMDKPKNKKEEMERSFMESRGPNGR